MLNMENINTFYLTTAQQTQKNICITFVQGRTSVEDLVPTLYKCYTNVGVLQMLYTFFVFAGRRHVYLGNPPKLCSNLIKFKLKKLTCK